MREVYEQDAHGERELSGGKYHWLWQHEVSTTDWRTLQPQTPYYLFIPSDALIGEEYRQGWALRAVLPQNSVGVVSARDKLTIHLSREEVLNTVRDFKDLPVEEARDKYALGDDARDWKVEYAQKDLHSVPVSSDLIVPILYRPFDSRFTYYTGQSRGFIGQPQQRIMRNMLVGENLAISTTRSIEIGRGWEHVFCSQQIIQHHTVSIKEVNYLFPLYLYDDAKVDLFNGEKPSDEPYPRRANLAPEFIADLIARLKMTFILDGKGDLSKTLGPEDVFDYMYTVFHSPTYRSRYAEFLKIDFPRLPLTSNPELFRKLCALGSELVGLHLMDQHAPAITTYPIAGANEVEKVRYTASGEGGAEEGRVWINREQYFEGVPPEVWNFYVGGYQVCQKWLKDRKTRKLTYADLTHYHQIVSALNKTIRLMSEIDTAIEDHGGWPIG